MSAVKVLSAVLESREDSVIHSHLEEKVDPQLLKRLMVEIFVEIKHPKAQDFVQ